MRGNRRLEGTTEGERPFGLLPRQKESRRVAAVSSSTSPFGQNEWLVEEMYRKFREDPSSVDPSWHEFLVDYSPEPTAGTSSTAGDGQPAAPTAPPEPGPAPAPKSADGNGAPAKAEQAPQPTARRRLDACQEEAPPAKTQPPPPRPTWRSPSRRSEARRETRLRRRRRGAGAARRRRRGREEHVGVAGRADRDQRARHPGQADDRQPHRHQQPPQAHPRRQDLVHPPAGLRDRAGGQEVPEHEPALRRGRRQAERRHPGAHQPRSGDRPAGQGRQPSAGRGGHQELPRPCGSASSSPPTRTSCGAPATAS